MVLARPLGVFRATIASSGRVGPTRCTVMQAHEFSVYDEEITVTVRLDKFELLESGSWAAGQLEQFQPKAAQCLLVRGLLPLACDRSAGQV